MLTEASAPRGFCVRSNQRSAFAFELSTDCDDSTLLVEVAPLEAECLSAAESCREHQRIKRLVAMSLKFLKKRRACSYVRVRPSRRLSFGALDSLATFLFTLPQRIPWSMAWARMYLIRRTVETESPLSIFTDKSRSTSAVVRLRVSCCRESG